ncbi:DUF2793 domain-containing protein [Parasphingopyxis marina]|uniref:DUF2793 domain-containing protein n=1 Tax=Parasphingopyxis marina TaxID=2761622 RepID=A0A842I323_9SPHN|nr:DUF2793 domain-containing protein [Parasphingopyxis marina]MBC2778304.1 DUF2793 domain-containing protein [Parasphingopyxis marina]
MTDTTARFALPLLQPGQAQKELYHNEALALLDSGLHPVAETSGEVVPPPSPDPGQSWIVGSAPTGEWSGQADALATWTESGWRILDPVEGMSVWIRADQFFARWDGAAWIPGEVIGESLKLGGEQVVGARKEAIENVFGGVTVDAEARAAIAAILAALRDHGLIAT